MSIFLMKLFNIEVTSSVINEIEKMSKFDYNFLFNHSKIAYSSCKINEGNCNIYD